MELDCYPETLETWDSLSDDYELAIKNLMSQERDFKYQIPVGYVVGEKKGWGYPVPSQIKSILETLDRVRFHQNMTITESVVALRALNVQVGSVQTVQNMFDKFEDYLGILPELPATVDKKATSNRQRLEWRRKRRVQSAERAKQRVLKEQRNALDKKIKIKDKQLKDDAKSAKLSLEEASLDHQNKLQATIAKLKAESAESRFEPEEEIDKDNILFEPTPKQAEFLAAPEKVVFYGG